MIKNQINKIIKLLAIFSIACFSFFVFNLHDAYAATRTWTGTTSGAWSVGSNWSGGVAPVTGDDLLFPGTASNLSNTNDLTENTIINSITISASGYTLSGNPLILGAGLAGITDSSSSGGNTIALDIRLDATRDIFVTNTAESLTISGRIAGVGGINKEGTGTLILSGANTFGGILKINVGVVNARNNRSLGTYLAGTEVVGGAALELQGDINISYEALALRGYGVSGGGALRNISGSNSYGGLITLSSGGGTEIASDSGTLTLKGGMAGAFPLVIDGAGNVTYSTAPIATAVSTVTKNGAGTLTYNFPNTYTGATTINAGTLLYGTDNAILSGTVFVTGGTLDIATYSDMVGTVTLGTLDLASGTITGSTGMLSSGSWVVYQGTISAIIAGQAGTLAKSTTGTVTLTRPNQYTGATTVTAGILKIQDSLSLGLIDGITTVSAGATLQIDGTGLSIPEYITFSGTGHLYSAAIHNTTGSNTLTGLLTMGAAAMIEADTGTTLTIDDKGISAVTFGLTIGGLGNTTFASDAPIYGTSATLTKQDAGTLTLQAFNNFTGATNINYGNLVLSGSGAMPLSTTMTISSGGKLTLDNSSSSTVVDRLADSLALTMNGGEFEMIGSSSADMDESAGVLTSGIATQSGNNIITIDPGSGGSTTMQFASLTRTAGSSILFRGNSFGSTPAANVSTLLFKTAPTLTGSAGLANSTTISIIAGAFGDDSTSGTGTDMVTYGVGNSNGLRLLNGAGFSGEYAFTLATNANVKLSTTTVAATSSINSLILSGSADITDAGTSQTITLTSGNILNLVSSNTIAGANTTIAGGAVELHVLNPVNLTISSNITGSTGLTKSGAGTLEFSSAKNYTGLTSVNQGTLLYSISNAISSGNVTVNGGTLDIATFTDSVGAVILQTGTITGSTGVLSGTSYSFREGTVSAIINGTGVALTRIATNTAPDSVVTLTRDNTYTGTTTITSGILKLGAAGGGTNTPLGIAGAGSETLIASGGALDLNGFTLGTAEAISSLAGTGYGASGSSNMGAIMNSSATPVSYSGALTLTAAARINADYGALTISGNASGNFALTFGGFSNLEYSGVRSGTSTIVKDGIGVLTLSNGNSSYTGATTISVGTVKIGAIAVGSNSPLGTTGGATSIATGSRLDLNGFSLGIAEPITNLNGVGYGLGDFASGAIINSSASAVTFTGLITLGAASTIKADNGDINLTAAGTISGAGFALTLGGTGTGTLSSIVGNTTGGVVKIGTGTWTLSGVSTYTGATAINLGTFKFGVSDAAGGGPLGVVTGATTVYSGAVLDLVTFSSSALAEPLTINGFGIDGGGAMISSNAAGATYLGTRALATDSRTTNNGAGTLTLSGIQSGAFESRYGGSGNITISAAIAATASSLYKDGSGTLNLTAANGHTGTTTVYAGTIAAGILNALSSGALVVKGGTYSMSTFSDTVGAVTLIGGSITSSSGVLTGTAYTMESGTVSAILAGAVAVTKNTNNTVTLTGVNTISSTTTINAGTLTISGSGSATATTITVNLGGTLTLDNSTTAVASRLGDALALTMNGGNFNFIGNSAAGSSETTGALTLSTGHNTVTVTPGTGGSTVMTFASLSRTAGATVLFRGTSLGTASAANISTLVFTATPTLTGAGGASSSTTVSVIKGAFGDTSLSGTGSDMVTYQGGTGLRLLNGAGFSGEYSTTLTTNTNVKLTADVAASTVSINSLILNGYGITNASATITLASASLSGNILMNSATNIAGANTTIGFGALELPVLSTNTSTISAILDTAAAGTLTLSGSGNVTLSASNAYTGTTFINGATLFAGASNVISSGGVTIVGGTYNLNGNSDTVGSISINAGTIATGAGTLTGNGTFTTVANNNVASIITGNLGLGANATFTIGDGLMDNDAFASAIISGGFTFAKAGAGAFMLSGNNTYSGATTISAGTLRLGAAGGGTNTPLGTTAGGTTVSGATAALDLNGYTLGTTEGLTLSGASLATGGLQNTSSTNVSYSGQIVLTTGAGTIIANYGDINITATGNMTGNTFGLTIGGAGNGTFASQLNTTSGTLTKNGVGVWTISGASSTFTGATTVSAGTLKLGAAGNGTNTPLGTNAGGISITSGAVFDLNGFTLGTAEALAINGTGIASIGAFINSSNNSISYSGVITPGATSRLANHGTGLFTLSGNIVGSTRAITFVTVGNITQSSSSVWSGTSTSLVKEGSGTLILAGQNSFTTGTVTVSTGVLQLGASGGATNTPLGTSGAGTTVSAGAVLDLSTYNLGGASTYETLAISGTGIKNGGALISSAASGTTNFGAVTVSANSIVTNSGAGTIAFTGAVGAAASINLWINGSGPTTISGVYGAATSATLTKDGAGTLTISAVATNTGLVRINGGTLAYGITDALATNAVTVAGGTWDLKGYSEGGTTIIGAVTLISGSIVNTGGAATITSSATYTVESGTISAVLAGAAIAMAKNTGGTVTLSAANTFAGTTTINAGTLAWGINNALSSGALTVTGGTADIATFTDTVGAVTLTSGSIIGSSGVLTGTSYPFASGTVSAILGGAIAVAKTTAGTVTMSGTNTYTGTTTITAGVLRATKSRALGDESANNTLIFNGGTLQAGGDISSPSGRAVTLTSAGTFDTNDYTITVAGTMGSASGLVKYGTGTLSTTGVVTLGSTMTINNGTYDQGNNLTSGAVTVATSGVWQNIGTGSVTLSSTVTNSGTITLNSGNGAFCVDGANSILVRSSVNNTTRAWSSGATGTGTFNLHNLDVDDMTGASVTVYNSTLSGDTTWTAANCISVSGTANGNDTATVKVAVNGTLGVSTGTISSSAWTVSVPATTNDIITTWVDNVADNLESTAITKYAGSGNITGMVLNTNVLTIGSNQNNSVSVTNMGQYEATDDEDVMHTSVTGALLVQGGSNSYTGETLSVLASNTLTVDSGSTESITTELLSNAGTITATGTPTINLSGTSGTLFTNSGVFTAASSTVDLTGNGSATVNSGTPTFYNLTSSGTGTKTLGANTTVTNITTISNGTLDTSFSNNYSLTTGKLVISGGTLTANNSTINLTASQGTLFTKSSGTFNSDTSTVNITNQSDQLSWVLSNYTQDVYSKIAVSANGARMIAGNASNGGMYYSTNYGLTWTQSNLTSGNASDAAMSADGLRAAVAVGTTIYTSDDGGATWTSRQTVSGVSGIAMSADGKKLAAVTWTVSNKVYVSTDYGVTWAASGSITSTSWNHISVSGDGTTMLASISNGQLYVSTDDGANWTPRGSSLNWKGVDTSYDGTKMVAGVYGGYIYTSTDSGANWSTNSNSSGSRNWFAVDSSADGQRLIATEYAGGGGANTQIYTSDDAGVTWVSQTDSDVSAAARYNSNGSSAGGLFAEGISTGTGYIRVTEPTTLASGTPSFYNLTLASGAYQNRLGEALTVTNNLTLTGGGLDTNAVSNYAISANKIILDGGTLSANASTISIAGTSGTLVTRSGNGYLDAGTSTVNLTGNGDATINSGSPVFYNLTSSGTGTKTLGAGITLATSGTLSVTAGTFNPATYLVTGTGTNTLSVGASGTIAVGASTFAGSYDSGFTTKTLNATSTVNYNLAGTQTIDQTLSYGNLTISTSGTKTLGGATTAVGTTTISGGTLDTSSGSSYTLNSGAISITGGTFLPNSSTINLSGAGTVFNYSSGTYTRTGETINLTDSSASSKTFAGGGQTFYNVVFAGTGTGDFIISGSNTFNKFSVINPPHTVKFTASSTQTVKEWDVKGTSDSLITLNSTSNGTDWNLYLAPTTAGYGAYTSEFISLRDSAASGNSNFISIHAGPGSVDDTTGGSTNTGWTFTFRSYGGGGGGVESSATPDADVGGGGQGGGGGGSEGSGNPDNPNSGGDQGGGGGGDIGFMLWKFTPSYIPRFFALASAFKSFF